MRDRVQRMSCQIKALSEENKQLKEELALSKIAFEMMDEMRVEAVVAQECVHYMDNGHTTACAMNLWADTHTSTFWDEVTCSDCQRVRAESAEARAREFVTQDKHSNCDHTLVKCLHCGEEGKPGKFLQRGKRTMTPAKSAALARATEGRKAAAAKRREEA